MLFAVIVPLVGAGIAMVMLWGRAFRWIDVALLVSLYVLCAFGTTIGFHRYFTHKGFEARLPVKVTLGILGCMTMQGPIIQWVTDHRKHHALSDQPATRIRRTPASATGSGAGCAASRTRTSAGCSRTSGWSRDACTGRISTRTA